MASLLKHTIAPSGADFTSVDAAIDHLVASHNNLVTADVYAELEISGDWTGGADTTQVVIPSSGLTGDATRYLEIYTIGTARHDGKWNTSAHRIEIANGDCLDIDTINLTHLRIDGLQLRVTGANGNYQVPVNFRTASPGSSTWLRNVIARQCGNNSYRLPCFLIDDSDTSAYLWNCIGYGMGTQDHGANSVVWMYAFSNLKIFNSVFIGGKYCTFLQGSGTAYLKNVYGGGSFTEDFYRNNGTLDKTNCASEDSSADDTGANENATNCLTSVALDTDTFVNVTGGSEDYHLAADGNSPLQGQGYDNSGESSPMNFSTDIDGDSMASISIGADDGPVLGLTISGVGNIASSVAFGTQKISRDVQAVGGIGSSAAFGTPSLRLNLQGVGGIASAAAFGTPSISRDIQAVGGIGSSVAFGTPKIRMNIALTGIPTSVGFGTPIVTLASGPQTIGAAGGIASNAAFGTPSLTLNVAGVGGISSGVAFGTPRIRMNIRLSGIPSSVAFGTPRLIYDQTIIGVGAIPSSVAFGTPRVLLQGLQTISLVGGIPTSAAFGTPTISITPHTGIPWGSWASQTRCADAGLKCPPAGLKCPPAGIKEKRGG